MPGCQALGARERPAAGGRRRLGSVAFHLKIDSGMNRLGIATSDMDCFARQLAKCPHLGLGGVMTHFASSEVFSNTPAGEQTHQQEERFYTPLHRLRSLSTHPVLLHLTTRP